MPKKNSASPVKPTQVRNRHRDHYTDTAAELESHGHAGDEQLLAWAQTEIDNLRAAFAWSRENSDLEIALRLISSLRPLWLRGGRYRGGVGRVRRHLGRRGSAGIAPAVWAGAVAHQSILAAGRAPRRLDRAQEALAIARELDDPALIARALIACGMLTIYSAEEAQQIFRRGHRSGPRGRRSVEPVPDLQLSGDRGRHGR